MTWLLKRLLCRASFDARVRCEQSYRAGIGKPPTDMPIANEAFDRPFGLSDAQFSELFLVRYGTLPIVIPEGSTFTPIGPLTEDRLHKILRAEYGLRPVPRRRSSDDTISICDETIIERRA